MAEENKSLGAKECCGSDLETKFNSDDYDWEKVKDIYDRGFHYVDVKHHILRIIKRLKSIGSIREEDYDKEVDKIFQEECGEKLSTDSVGEAKE